MVSTANPSPSRNTRAISKLSSQLGTTRVLIMWSSTQLSRRQWKDSPRIKLGVLPRCATSIILWGHQASRYFAMPSRLDQYKIATSQPRMLTMLKPFGVLLYQGERAELPGLQLILALSNSHWRSPSNCTRGTGKWNSTWTTSPSVGFGS